MSAALRFVGIVATLLLFAGSALGQTLACIPSAPRTDPGVGFVPFGATEGLLARGGQSGPAWEWALGTDYEGTQKSQGSLDWVSGKTYAWTLAYNGSRAATLEVRDGATLVLSLNYVSGMDAGNALQLQVSTNPSIGADTTISASASSINTQSASGSVSLTGNNQESSQSLHFYYPPMSQGFTATGTVSLTYSSLPSGSRVQFNLRAGTIPCSNLAPTVSITAPAAGSLHQAGSAITISANAADADGTVQSVQFLANGSPIGTDTTSPYGIAWTPAADSYSLTARATDNAGDQTLSAAVAITVNAQPTAVITSPASGTVVQAPGSVTLTATAADTDGTITKVDFYQGATLVGTATSSPYTANVTGLAAGTYSFTAVATDNQNGTGTSAAVSVRVNAAPTVSITSPASGTVVPAPGSVTLTATASDADGTLQKVDFYQGTTLVGTATSSPFTASVSGLASGSYSFTAVATDNDNAQTTSAAVSVTVNSAPAVSITSPANNATFNAPANITITANATDSDGTINRVELYANASLIATLTASPYTFNWTGVAAGSYALTAKAVDNNNAETVSTAVNITVTVASTLYFIHPDHLNTPRLVADATGTTVWSRPPQEPFGVSPPDENPSSLGVFPFPLRESNYYENKETGTFYAMQRDCFDPATGRFCQSDPIGLRGGLNTYAFVFNDPLRKSDPTGLLSACQINWLNANYGDLGGFLVNLFNVQQYNPNDPEFGKNVVQAGEAAVVKYGVPGGVQYLGNRVAQRAVTAAISLAGQATAAAGFCASATLTVGGGGLTTFATAAYQFSMQACTDPLTGKQRD